MIDLNRSGISHPRAVFRAAGGWLAAVRYTVQMTLEQQELRALDAKLKVILPLEYQACYEDVQPVPMRSAGLKYDASGRVAWDEIWQSFCDLAMAGGPPHKGRLLEPAGRAEIEAEPQRYREVAGEICRGIRMVSCQVAAEPSPDPGWVRVMCPTRIMAGWLVRAIVMENVSARLKGSTVELPAGPRFRLEKEIKNVVTVTAKTCHYFEGHLEPRQQLKIGAIFAEADARWPLLQPDPAAAAEAWKTRTAAKLREATGLCAGGEQYRGWLGVETGNAAAAIWMMRALMPDNVLARREGTVLYVPANPAADPEGDVVLEAVRKVHRLAGVRGILRKDA